MWNNGNKEKVEKKYRIIAIILLFFIVLFCSFLPKNICKNSDNIRIDRIVYNSQFKSNKNEYNRIEIEKFDSDAIVECISDYKSYLTLTRATGYQLKDSEIEVFLTINGKGKHIVLGNVNYEIWNNGLLRRNIIDANTLNEKIKILLNLSERGYK